MAPDIPRGSAGSVDVSPVWSRDGKYIAFRRRSPSSDGPPGLYIVPSAGGPIHFVTPGDFFFPTEMRFSPDGRRIVYMAGLQLYIVDIATGATTRLPIPEDGAIYPDWSPDGRYIVYASSGIRLFDLLTGESRLIPGDSTQGITVYGGHFPLWSPDGTQIAIIQSFPREARIAIFNRDGTGYRVLAATGNPIVSYDILHWYVRPTRGMEGLAFRQITGPGSGRYYASRDGRELRRFEHRFEEHDAYSPDGEWIVGTGIDPVDSLALLFIERVDDVTGATRRQLTYWDPPATPGLEARRLPVERNDPPGIPRSQPLTREVAHVQARP